MSDNLTKKELVSNAHGLDPIPGHSLVVFKQLRSGGKEFRDLLGPDQLFKKAWSERVSDFVTYYVTQDKQLRLSFSQACQTTDQLLSFTLHYTLTYCVSDPRLVCEKLENNGDPLQRLVDEIKAKIGPTVEAWDVTVIKDSQASMESALHTETRNASGVLEPNLSQLQGFAAQLGMELKFILLSRVLSEDEIRVRLREKEVGREDAIKEIEHDARLRDDERSRERDIANKQHGSKLRQMDRVNDLYDSMAQDTARAISRSADDIRSFADMRNALKDVHVIKQDLIGVTAGVGVAEGSSTMLPSSDEKLRLAAPQSSSQLVHVLLNAYETFADFPSEEADRRRLFAAILHLLAAKLIANSPEDPDLQHHLTEFQACFEDLVLDMSDGQRAFMQKLQKLPEIVLF